MNNATKSVILARVSSKEQEIEGYSLSAQEKLLKDYAERTKLKLDKVYSIAESASKSTQRLIFQQMMEYVEKKNIKIIVCEKVDRFVRNFKDTVMVDDWLECDEERKIHFVKDSLVLHRNSRSQEKLNWGMRVVIAKNYIDNLKEEVEKGQLEKLEQGWLPATPPLGYKNTGDVGRKIQIIDESVSPLVRLMFELYNSGEHSLSTLTDLMRLKGLRSSRGRELSKSHIYSILINKYYIGTMTWKNKEYDGKHDTFISNELFNNVQYRLKRPNPPKYNKHNPLFKGVMSCVGCSKTITWEFQRKYWYGHCNTKSCPSKQSKWAREDNIEKQLLTYFDDLVSPSAAIIDWVKDQLKVTHKDEIEIHNVSYDQLEKRQSRIDQMLDDLYDDKLEGLISKDRYKIKLKTLQSEKQEVIKAIKRLGNTKVNFIEKGVEILERTQNAAMLYSRKDKVQRRALIRDIFSNIGLNGQVLLCEYKKEAAMVLEKVEMTKSLQQTFEHNENGSFKDETGLIIASRSIWLGR